MKYRNKYVCSVFMGTLLSFLCYIIIHELGHLLVAVSCGAHITQFRVVSAHVSYTGGNFQPLTLSLLHAAGMLTSVITCVMLIALFQTSWKNMLVRSFCFFYSVFTIFSISAWMVMPILYMLDRGGNQDDVIKFLEVSHIHPLALMAGAAGIMIFLGGWMYKRGVLHSFLRMQYGSDAQASA